MPWQDLLEADRAQPTEYRWSRASDWGEALGLALNQAGAVLLAKHFRKPVSRLISGQIGIIFKFYCQYRYRHLGIYYYRSCLLRAIQWFTSQMSARGLLVAGSHTFKSNKTNKLNTRKLLIGAVSSWQIIFLLSVILTLHINGVTVTIMWHFKVMFTLNI